MDICELLSARRDAIIRRWAQKVRGSLHPEEMPPLELVDHLPAFLDEVAEALRANASPDKSATAAQHGIQRLALGFNLESVVREYGALRNTIVETADDEGVPIADRDRDVLADSVITGIAEAVSQYQRQRDAEQHRQTSEHFGFLAHELRDPLGSAVAAVALLRKKGKIPAEERASEVLDRSLARLQELIDGTLRNARIGAGVTLRREPLMLRSLLEDAETAATANAEEKGVVLTLHIESDSEVLVDARLVRSALTNLVRNAVKFTHPGGRVEVRGRRDEARVVIEVEDRCGGLPPGAVERAFAPFVQLGADRSGFGLGLAIAKQAADAHGGAIRIQNLPGKGCIFVLELPLVAQPAEYEKREHA